MQNTFRDPVHHHTKQHGWDPTSQVYQAHITTIESAPSALYDVPHYPDVHKAFRNKAVYVSEQDYEVQQAQQHHHWQPPTAVLQPKKVHFVEEEQIIEQDGRGRCEVIEEVIDTESNGFIEERHRKFELCKWKTFKT